MFCSSRLSAHDLDSTCEDVDARVVLRKNHLFVLLDISISTTQRVRDVRVDVVMLSELFKTLSISLSLFMHSNSTLTTQLERRVLFRACVRARSELHFVLFDDTTPRHTPSKRKLRNQRYSFSAFIPASVVRSGSFNLLRARRFRDLKGDVVLSPRMYTR